MATATISYGTPANLTITLNNKANNVWQESTYVNNASDLYIDAFISGSIQAGTTPTNGNTFDIYAYGYDGTAYTGGCSGANAVYTADGEEDELVYVTSITVDATTDQDYVFGPVALARKFGGALPSRWGIVVKNGTGVTTNTTGTNNRITYVGIKYASA